MTPPREPEARPVVRAGTRLVVGRRTGVVSMVLRSPEGAPHGLTAGHLFDDGEAVRLRNGWRASWPVGERVVDLLAGEPPLDAAVFAIGDPLRPAPGPPPGALPAGGGRCSVDLGDQARHATFFHGGALAFTCDAGAWTLPATLLAWPRVTDPGDSGAPVLNGARVVGLVVGAVGDRTIAQPIAAVLERLPGWKPW